LEGEEGDDVSMNRASGCFVNGGPAGDSFPLTPTLSLGEREIRGSANPWARFVVQVRVVKTWEFSMVFDDADFDVVANGCDGLGKFGGEAGILKVGIGLLQGAPFLDQG